MKWFLIGPVLAVLAAIALGVGLSVWYDLNPNAWIFEFWRRRRK